LENVKNLVILNNHRIKIVKDVIFEMTQKHRQGYYCDLKLNNIIVQQSDDGVPFAKIDNHQKRYTLEKTEVLNYGEFLWEMLYTQPTGQTLTNIEHKKCSGNKLPLPNEEELQNKSAKDYISLIRKCTNPALDQRPSFSEISRYLTNMKEFKYDCKFDLENV